MRPEPSCKLNSKVKSVWRICEAILVVLCWLCLGLPLHIAGVVSGDGTVQFAAGFVTGVCIVALVFFAVVFPNIRYVRWRYEVGEHELDIMRGIFWRKRFVIPFIRVQNTDTKQGPVMRAFGLAQVTVATAAGEHVIPGLTVEEADALRDAIATQARLAQEDL